MSAEWAFGSGGFAKLVGDRLRESSLLDLTVATRWVFLFMLSQADREGRFRCATVKSLARAANVTLTQAQRAVDELGAPDPDSTTPANEGRRITRLSGGWQIVNYQHYREFRTAEQMSAAERKRRQRERDMSRDVTPDHDTEGRGQRADDRRQKTEGGAQPETAARRRRVLELLDRIIAAEAKLLELGVRSRPRDPILQVWRGVVPETDWKRWAPNRDPKTCDPGTLIGAEGALAAEAEELESYLRDYGPDE